MQTQPTPPFLKHIETISRLMDSRFRVPGTSFRFGLDPLIGLIPGIGDVSGFVVSGLMLLVMIRNGASGFVLARMVLNVVLDALIGSIPVVGDLFDMAFRANQRNLKLMREHYEEGRHQGSAWKVIIPVLLILLLLVILICWAVYRFIGWLVHLAF